MIIGYKCSEIPRFLQNSNIKYRLVKRKEVVLVQIQLKHRGWLISVDHLCDFQTFGLIAGSSSGLLTHPGKKKENGAQNKTSRGDTSGECEQLWFPVMQSKSLVSREALTFYLLFL